MERELTCFQWQNHSSDYLDGQLPVDLKELADQHLARCDKCNERLSHFQNILGLIQEQPTHAVPDAIRAKPIHRLPRPSAGIKMRLSRWERIPWYVRTLLEGVGIVAVVIGGISYAPHLRNLYETRIERNLNEFRENLNVAEPLVDEDPNTMPLLEKLSAELANATPSQISETRDELEGEDEPTEKTKNGAGTAQEVHVGRSQLWRFTLKTPTPEELRVKVVNALVKLGVPPLTPRLGGVKVPGGIEFDLVLPQSMVADLKNSLEGLAPSAPTGSAANFSWYRVKSKRKIPAGKSQVVIWITG